MRTPPPAAPRGSERLSEALWRIFRRPDRPTAWENGGNLPWNEPAFAERMLREHLDQSHGAASRTTPERHAQIEWLWHHLSLHEQSTEPVRICDVTCGPGLYAVDLARRGARVTGIDFSPASIAHAREFAQRSDVSERCTFIEQDVREMALAPNSFDAAVFLYGQLAVFPQDEAQRLLNQIAATLVPGGRLCVELLHPDRIDKTNSNWWFTDDTGLWGDAPFLHLGERFWDGEANLAMERFYTLHLESGQMDEVLLCDQMYTPERMTEMMRTAGFTRVDVFENWDGVELYDADEWLVYIAQR